MKFDWFLLWIALLILIKWTDSQMSDLDKRISLIEAGISQCLKV